MCGITEEIYEIGKEEGLLPGKAEPKESGLPSLP